MSEPSLTIITAAFHNAQHLALNWELTTALNHGSDNWGWIVAENTPEGAEAKLPADDTRFKIVPGIEPRPNPAYQHTMALNQILQQVESHFLLVLDPDFYIVRHNWISEILTYMQENDLAFFGVPWHTNHPSKYRYFPCVHCLFVDLKQINYRDLDFRPGIPDVLVEEFRDWHQRQLTWYVGTNPVMRMLDRVLNLQKRLYLVQDSGHRVYEKFGTNRRIRYTSATPVLRGPYQFWKKKIRKPGYRLNRLIEVFLPDRLCFLPKKHGAYTQKGLREHGYLIQASQDWEEFMWQNRPFGFHLRRYFHGQNRDSHSELTSLELALKPFLRGDSQG